MEDWKEKREQDFFYFRPATLENETTNADSDVVFPNGMEDEDDILYLCPDNSDHHEPSSLLFIHQSYDQLQILKWYRSITFLFQFTKLEMKFRAQITKTVEIFVGIQGLF